MRKVENENEARSGGLVLKLDGLEKGAKTRRRVENRDADWAGPPPIEPEPPQSRCFSCLMAWLLELHVMFMFNGSIPLNKQLDPDIYSDTLIVSHSGY